MESTQINPFQNSLLLIFKFQLKFLFTVNPVPFILFLYSFPFEDILVLIKDISLNDLKVATIIPM